MIIRPATRENYVALPNIVLNDRRLSIGARGMLAYLLSKPRNWQLRLVPLMKALSREGEPLGRRRLDRMLREAMDAGYLARSDKQGHADDGKFGRYTYIVGLPEDVQAELLKRDQPCVQNAHARDAHTHDAHAQNGDASHKVKTLKITDSDKSPQPPTKRGARQRTGKGKYTPFGEVARANGMQFVWEKSKPFSRWREFRGLDGMPPIDEVTMEDGVVRRGVWLPTLYPPEHHAGEEDGE